MNNKMSQFQQFCKFFVVYAALLLNAKKALADKTPSLEESPIFMNLGLEQWKVTNSNGSISVLFLHLYQGYNVANISSAKD